MMNERYWSRKARQVSPYTPGEQPKIQNLIKLNTNENPYPPSERAKEALRNADMDALRLYPDPESAELRAAIAHVHGSAPEQVFVGNGSDEVLALLFMAFFDVDEPVAMPDISYSFYPVYARLCGLQTRTIPLREDFTLSAQDYAGCKGGIIFANPNAPTGRAISLGDIETICKNHERVVVVDEAYVNFGAESALPLIARYDNLLVVRTLSKSHSLAGLRVGYALGHPALIEALERIKNSFNSYPLDRLAQAAAKAAIEDTEYTRQCSEKIMDTRERVVAHLITMGFDVIPSKTNFVFCTHPKTHARAIQQQLRERAILVRRFDAPRIDNYLRISMGTDTEMEALIRALEAIV